ncbi:aly/REF export factor 2 isoform X2 [Procambarus clarkii]|uniref:aly/REF export factor 2 isoform X2 n=1 Tax=Procambarus clarkii TaxID=6728 RepID=UPI001E6727B5|nr:THO complex subunit 4-like isoform X2 [Procambarus clarkii]
MATKVDMSLDDIIKTQKIKPGTRRGGGVGRGVRGRGRGGVRRGITGGQTRGRPGQRPMAATRQPFGQRGNVDGRWSHDMYQGGGIRTQQLSGPAKLLISNLDFGVSDSDIHELFAEFGTMRNAAVHYDRSGRSLGTAHVVFERHADALKALKQYNGVHLDGRPMSITMDGGSPAGGLRNAAPLKRLSQGPRPISSGFGSRGGGRGVRGSTRGVRGSRGGTRGGSGGRGRGFGGRGARTKVPTAEELDAELDAYVNQVNK